MASYYDEHDCRPLEDGEHPNHLLHLARLLIDGGYTADIDLQFDNIFTDGHPPPASKQAVKDLPTVKASAEQEARGLKCMICLVEFSEGEDMKEMPCCHLFHPRCVLPWLEKTNSCPLCRHELPTDDADYEEYRKQKARAKQRQFEIDSLHESMFG